MSAPDFRDTAHLVTGTLDTSGYGEGDLRDVALVYKNPPQEPAPGAEAPAEPEPDADADVRPPPLFTPDGEPTRQALPEPEAPQIGQQVRDAESGGLRQPDGTGWIEVPEQADGPQPETTPASGEPDADGTAGVPADAPPVEHTAHADKESKAPEGAKTRRRTAAG